MGLLEAIFIKIQKYQPLEKTDAAYCLENKGILGNYNQGGNRQVTILEKEKWEEANQLLGVVLHPSLRRANLYVSGISLEESKGKILTVGKIQILIKGETAPCHRMDEVHPGLKEVLSQNWRGGAYGIIVNSGEIKVGNQVSFV